MKRPHRPAHRLRQTIDCMPLATRQAMLHALAANPIIVGAYTDRDGGVCPMLAAHRNGGRTSFAAFAVAWDRYTRAGKGSRLATEREVRTLRTMLEASIDADTGGRGDLGEAIVAHHAARKRRGTVPVRRSTGERDRGARRAPACGWAWRRPFRRLDEYERALDELEGAPADGAARAPAQVS